jgi:NADPH:quinone reductase-like Zn-dependent oxidoreductase
MTDRTAASAAGPTSGEVTLMKAIVQNAYGTADVLTFTDIVKPVPGEDDVLVRVRAASLHAGDHILLRGVPYPARFFVGWPKPRNFVPGLSMAGVVEAVGARVQYLKPGDEVFGEGRGACAEFALGTEKTLVAKPTGLTFEQAAAIPTSALTAQHGLRDAAKVQPGQRVLINGASGGVGIYAVQIAKALGAHVTGVCSTGNVEMVQGLGADEVIDYTTEEFVNRGPIYDLIFDNVGNHSFTEVRRALTPTGVVIPNAGTVSVGSMVGSMIRSLFARQKDLRFISTPNRADLLALTELIDSGRLTTVIDRTYRLDQTPDAMTYLGTGHARGKVVILVAP